MKRRDFVRTSLAAAGAAAVSGGVAAAQASTPAAGAATAPRHNFKLKYAPHFGMFENSAGKDLLDQLRFAAEVGFKAWEDNGMRGRDRATQDAIAREMERLGMEMGVFIPHTIFWDKPNLAGGGKEYLDQFVKELTESVEVAKRVNAKYMVTVPGAYDPRLDIFIQTANVVDAYRRAVEVLEPHGLTLVMEALNSRRDHPGIFLDRVTHNYMIVKAVNSPSLKVLFDFYHQQVMEGNLIPNFERTYDQIGYIQTGDHPGRVEPMAGETNYRRIFETVYKKGYQGIVGMEHGKSLPGKAGEDRLIQAYVESDSFPV